MPTSDEDSDFEQLTIAATKGDRDALETLLERCLPDLRAFVRLKIGPIVRRRAGESDVVQSVCREVLTHADRFQHPSESAFRRWLFATAIRKLVNQRDHWVADRRDVGRDAHGEEAVRGLEAAYGRVATPSRHASFREQLERVENAMKSLSEDEQTIILLSRIVGLSRAEIAEELGISDGAVRMRLHRALGNLAVVLD